MLDIRRDALWASFLEKIGDHLHGQFVWNVSALATDISDRADLSGDDDIRTTCGQVARKLAKWFWSRMDQENGTWLTNVGTHWILPLVVKTS